MRASPPMRFLRHPVVATLLVTAIASAAAARVWSHRLREESRDAKRESGGGRPGETPKTPTIVAPESKGERPRSGDGAAPPSPVVARARPRFDPPAPPRHRPAPPRDIAREARAGRLSLPPPAA